MNNKKYLLILTILITQTILTSLFYLLNYFNIVELPFFLVFILILSLIFSILVYLAYFFRGMKISKYYNKLFKLLMYALLTVNVYLIVDSFSTSIRTLDLFYYDLSRFRHFLYYLYMNDLSIIIAVLSLVYLYIYKLIFNR